MTVFRPSKPLAAFATTFFGLGGIFLLLNSDALPKRVAGGAGLFLALTAVLLAVRVYVAIGADGVVVRTLRPAVRFAAGSARVTVFETPSIFRREYAVHVVAQDGRSHGFTLGVFRRADRAEIVRLLRETLEGEHSDEP